MESSIRPARSGSRLAPSGEALRGRMRAWTSRGKQALVAAALVGSAAFVGPVAAAPPAAASPTPLRLIVEPPQPPTDTKSSERALSARLAVEYAGALTAADIEKLVRHVSAQLQRDGSPPERLLRTIEAVCRRALTDFLARGSVLA